MISRKNRALALVLAVLGQQAFAAQKPKYAYEIFIDKNINHDLSADKRVDKVFVQTYTREKRFADLMNKLKITDKTLKIVNKGIPVVEVGGKIVAYGLGQPEVAGAVSKVSKGIGQVAGVGVKIAKKALTSQYTAEQHKSRKPGEKIQLPYKKILKYKNPDKPLTAEELKKKKEWEFRRSHLYLVFYMKGKTAGASYGILRDKKGNALLKDKKGNPLAQILGFYVTYGTQLDVTSNDAGYEIRVRKGKIEPRHAIPPSQRRLG